MGGDLRLPVSGAFQAWHGDEMVIPWTGLHQLVSANSVVTWLDFSFLVAIYRERGAGGQAVYIHQGLGQRVKAACDSVDRWSRQYFDRDTPPLSKAVGRVLAHAVTGMLAENGVGVPLDSPGLPLRHLHPRRCARLDPSRLPEDHKCTVSMVPPRDYPDIQFGRWEATKEVVVAGRPTTVAVDRQNVGIRGHRLVCWLAHGDPPAAMLKPEASHSCHRKWCCNPAHLGWRTHAANMASPGGRKPARKRCAVGGAARVAARDSGALAGFGLLAGLGARGGLLWRAPGWACKCGGWRRGIGAMA